MTISNGFNRDKLKGYLSEIDRHDDELASLKGSYMEQCKRPRAAINEILTTVKDDGVNTVAFRQLLKSHRAERAEDKRIAALDMADRADYEAMMDALGAYADTPLGQAALDRVKPRDDEAALDSLGRGS